jgi:hypothetical protein
VKQSDEFYGAIGNGSAPYVHTCLCQRNGKRLLRADGSFEGRNVVRHWANEATQAPEIQTMYSLNLPVSALRTKVRQEFERHRYVNQIGVVDMLLFQSHAEYQVRWSFLVVEEPLKALDQQLHNKLQLSELDFTRSAILWYQS